MTTTFSATTSRYFQLCSLFIENEKNMAVNKDFSRSFSKWIKYIYRLKADYECSLNFYEFQISNLRHA